MSLQVLFTGSKSVKHADFDHFEGTVSVQPSIVIQDEKWGLLFTCTNASGQDVHKEFHGNEHFNDLIRLWRSVRFAEVAKTLDSDDISLFYFTAHRNAERIFKRYVKDITDKIGLQQYQDILREAIPDQIVRLIIQLVYAGHDIELDSISDEIGKTVRWSQELKDIGFQYPDNNRAR